MGFLKRRSRKKEVEALSEKHGAPLIENEDYKDKPNFFKSYSKEFLDKACNEYLSGHYNACIIFSGQAVELSLLFELYLHKTKDEEWTEFIDKWNYAPSLGQLKDLHKRQNNDIISESTIEKSEDLNNLRNAYAHYPNFLIQASRRSPSKEFDRQIRRISNKIGFDVSPYKPHVEPILNKFLKSRKGITLDEAEEMIGSLREFEGLGKSSSVDKLEKLRSERLDSSTDRVAEKIGRIDSHDTIGKITLLAKLPAMLIEAMIGSKELWGRQDALLSLQLAFEILSDLGYLKLNSSKG